MTDTSWTESELIALFRGPQILGTPPTTAPKDDDFLVVPNGDDAAAFTLPQNVLSVVTTDSLVDHVHFDLQLSPAFDVGRKLVAVNLSDLAAMGAKPKYFLLSLGVPHNYPWPSLVEIARGIHHAVQTYDVQIIGGNVCRADTLFLTATAFGEAEPKHVVRRQGAQIGDLLYVTGDLGAARAGLELAPHQEQRQKFPQLYQSFCCPTPRIESGRKLAELGVHSMCDISDGLRLDVHNLLHAGALGAEIWVEKLPCSHELKTFAGDSAIDYALVGGEDYELLFTAPATFEVPKTTPNMTHPIHAPEIRPIGRIVETPGVHLLDNQGRTFRPLRLQSYQHFAHKSA